MTGNRGSGLFAELSQRVRFASNVVASNGGAGVKVTGSRDVVLERNTLCDNAGHELVVASDRRTADDLGISIKTVEAHRANIMEKLNANTVADLLKIALGQSAPKT